MTPMEQWLSLAGRRAECFTYKVVGHDLIMEHIVCFEGIRIGIRSVRLPVECRKMVIWGELHNPDFDPIQFTEQRMIAEMTHQLQSVRSTKDKPE